MTPTKEQNRFFSATRTRTRTKPIPLTTLWFGPPTPLLYHRPQLKKDTNPQFPVRMSRGGGKGNRHKKRQKKKEKKKPQSNDNANTLQNVDGDDGGIPAMAQVYPEQYETLLAKKVDKLSSLLREAIVDHSQNIMASPSYLKKELQLILPIPQMQIFESPQKQGFRMRATFHIWRTTTNTTMTTATATATTTATKMEEENMEKPVIRDVPKEEENHNDVDYVMFEPGTKNPYKVTQYPMGSTRLQELMDPVRNGLSRHQILSSKLKDVRFHTILYTGTGTQRNHQDQTPDQDTTTTGTRNTTTTDAIIVLNYYDPASLMDEKWKKAAQELQKRLSSSSSSGGGGAGRAVTIIGKSRKLATSQHVVVGETTQLYEQLVVPTGGGRIDDDDDDNDGKITPVNTTTTTTTYRYYQTEGAFSQPNARVCQQMLGWAYNVTASPVPSIMKDRDDNEKHDLCELYCGNGCFTVVLASNFRHVVATELSQKSVQLAQQNLKINSVTNARVVQMTAEEFVTVLEEQEQNEDGESGSTVTTRTRARAKSITKLHNAGITNLVGSIGRRRRKNRQLEDDDVTTTTDGYKNIQPPSNNNNSSNTLLPLDQLRTLFVDPPRAGLDKGVRQLASQYFDRIIYMSCNPETLQRDLMADLLLTHRITKVAAFDQFPYTPHLEVGIVLERRQ